MTIDEKLKYIRAHLESAKFKYNNFEGNSTLADEDFEKYIEAEMKCHNIDREMAIEILYDLSKNTMLR